MPSQADDSFLRTKSSFVMYFCIGNKCQCPLRLMTHFYLLKWSIILKMHQSCQCPLRLMTHFYNHRKRRKPIWLRRVNALSGWWLISTVAYTLEETNLSEKCQCPLGLMTHFYMVMLKDRDGVFSGVNALSGWWLISTPEMYYLAFDTMLRVNALSGWWLISTWYKLF